MYFDPENDSLVTALAQRFRVRPEVLRSGRWEELGVDSLDLIELVMELERAGT